MKNKKSMVEIDWRASGGKIVFFEVQGGEELFQMAGERVGLLLNGNYVKDQLRGPGQERTFPESWGLEKLVEAQRLMKKGLGQSMIAKFWGTTDAAVRAFYSQALQKFQHSPQGVQNEWDRQGSSEIEKDFCLSKKVRDSNRVGDYGLPGQEFLVVPFVAGLLKELGSTLAVSSRLMVDADDFKLWVERNKKYLRLFGYES